MTGAIGKRTELILEPIIAWALSRSDIRAIALAGSQARNTARPDSDIDVLLLVVDQARFFPHTEWVAHIDWRCAGIEVAGFTDARYGVCASRHLMFDTGPEVELGFVPLSWSDCDPVDAGTQKVVIEGFRVLYDPDRRLAELLVSIMP